MKKLRVAFFKAEHGEVDDTIIAKRHKPHRYSHCEVMVSETTMIGAHYLAKGVKKFNYNNVINSEKWDVYELDINSKYGIEYAEACIGVGYDLKGAVLHFVGIKFYEDPDKVWCSEFCALCINKAINPLGGIETIENTCIMPNELAHIMIESGAKLIVNTKSKKSRSKINYKPEVDRFGRI